MRGYHLVRSRFHVYLFLMLTTLAWGPAYGLAHCDGMDGPVVKAAQDALATGDVNRVLLWVSEGDETEIHRVFQKTLAVRRLNAESKELADLYFFETVVRLHRTGEGALYTGLKPAGRDLGPAIPAADKAIVAGEVEPLLRLLMDAVQQGVHSSFQTANARKNFPAENIEAGRAYVRAYVEFIHYVERLYEAATLPAHGHVPEPEEHSSAPEQH